MEDYNIDYLFNEVASKTIKKYREEKKMSLEEVVKKMNNPISRQSLFKYENNLARMKTSTFIDICKVLLIDPNEVFEEINRITFNLIALNKDLPKPFNFPIFEKNGEVFYAQVGADKDSFDYNSLNEINNNNKRNFDELELLFDKAKPHLSEDDKETMKFLMQKTINNYEKSKKQDN